MGSDLDQYILRLSIGLGRRVAYISRPRCTEGLARGDPIGEAKYVRLVRAGLARS